RSNAAKKPCAGLALRAQAAARSANGKASSRRPERISSKAFPASAFGCAGNVLQQIAFDRAAAHALEDHLVLVEGAYGLIHDERVPGRGHLEGHKDGAVPVAPLEAAGVLAFPAARIVVSLAHAQPLLEAVSA